MDFEWPGPSHVSSNGSVDRLLYLRAQGSSCILFYEGVKRGSCPSHSTRRFAGKTVLEIHKNPRDTHYFRSLALSPRWTQMWPATLSTCHLGSVDAKERAKVFPQPSLGIDQDRSYVFFTPGCLPRAWHSVFFVFNIALIDGR